MTGSDFWEDLLIFFVVCTLIYTIIILPIILAIKPFLIYLPLIPKITLYFGSLVVGLFLIVRALIDYRNGLEHAKQDQLQELEKQKKQTEAELKKNQELREQREKEERIERYWNFVDDIAVIFYLRGSNVIPPSLKHHSESLLKAAQERAHEFENEHYEIVSRMRNRAETWKDACKTVWKLKGLPESYFIMPESTKQQHLKALELLEKNQLEVIVKQFKDEDVESKSAKPEAEDYRSFFDDEITGRLREKQLLTLDFYYRSDLAPKEEAFLIKFHKFEQKKLSDFGNGFIDAVYRCNRKNESPLHFCTKHMFARLHPSGRIEYKDFWGNEIDIMFSKGQKKFAVEIERGTNKPEYLRQKLSNLGPHYTSVLVVVPRKELARYKQYHDGKNIFISTPKEAKELILKWLG